MSGIVRVSWKDKASFDKFENQISTLTPQELGVIARRAVNHTGNKALTGVKLALSRQTGLSKQAVTSRLKVKRATSKRAEYVISSTGEDIALRYFKAKETERGVVASPFGKKQLFPHTFMRGGRWPRRVEIHGFRGNVMERVGTGRFPVQRVRSGVILPEQLMEEVSTQAFLKAMAELPARFAHEIGFSRELQERTGGARF